MGRKASNKPQKKKAKQTIKEFKAWLAGIAEFQSDDWCPNAEQWTLIKEKIANLQDDVIFQEAAQLTAYNTQSPPQRRRVMPSIMAPQEREQIGLETSVVSIPLIQPVEASLPIPPIPNQIASPNVENISSVVKFSGKSFKTPHVNNDPAFGGGAYKSPFA
jgi:hypothetical protein